MKRRNFLRTLAIVPISTIPIFGREMGLGSGNSPMISQNDFGNQNDVVGLKKIIDIIEADEGLQQNVTPEALRIATQCAKKMNQIIIEAIIQTGAGNDKKITTADTREINDYIFHNYHDQWIMIHGDDEDDGEETGFHKIQGNGARTKLFKRNAINKVADSIYHLGFESHRKNRLLNEDGDDNATYKRVAEWLDALLREDLEAGRLANPDVSEVIGDTDTGLDEIISVIYNDVGLQKRISLGDIRTGSASANEMNGWIIEAIQATNASDGGEFTLEDAKNINVYLVENYAEQWAEVHGDDEEEGEETGFHLVQSDGAKTRLYGKNAVNKVFDGIFHLGFETPHKRRLVNEDGDKNASFKKVAFWLNQLLADDLANQTI